MSREKSGLALQLAQYERERQRLEDAVALHELAEEANDEATRAEAKQAAAEQRVPGSTEVIEYETPDGKWHSETAAGGDRPETEVEDKP